MSAISLKSITGITSITTPAGVDDQLTLHNNNTTERVKIDVAGNVHINNQLAIAGVTTTSTVNLATNARANFASNNRLSIHSNGTNSYLDYGGSLNVRGSSGSAAALSFLSDSNVLVSNSLSINDDLDVDGHTNLDNVSVAGIITVTTSTQYHGYKLSNGSNLVGELVGLSGSNDTGALALWSGGSKYVQLSAIGDSFINGGRLLVGTATTKSAGSGQYAKLNVEGYAGGSECFMSLSRAEAASAMSANDEVANLTFNDSVGYEFARIQVLADAATGATDTPGRLVFRTTADGASSSTERIRISSDGKVGFNNPTLDNDFVFKCGTGAHTVMQVRSASESTKFTIQTVQDSDVRVGTVSNHPLNVYTNSLNRVHIHDDGWCMLNTSTLGSSKTAKELIVSYNNDGVSGGDQGRAGITIRSGDNSSNVTQNGYIYFSDGTSGDNESKGGIVYEHSNDAFYFATNNTEKLRIKSDGDIEVTGNLQTNNLSGRNIVINGDMRIAQRATSASMSNHGSTYDVCDRWQYNRNGVTATIAQVAEAPDGSGFKYSLKWTSTSAVGSISAGNALIFLYKIEGQDIRRLGYGHSSGKIATLSFYAKGSLAGKVGVNCRRDGRIFSANSDMTANTWQRHSIVIPVDASTGFSANDNANGMQFGICWGAGSNSTSGTTNGSWINFHNAYTGGFTAGQQGAYLTTNGSTFQITGVQLEIGSQATPFEHRSISEELARCQRYYEGIKMGTGTAIFRTWTNTAGSPTNVSNVEYNYKVEKRATPTWSLEGNATWYPSGTSGMTAYPSTSTCLFQRNDTTHQFLADGVGDLCGSFSAEL